MTFVAESYARWLADYYLLAAVLLTLALAGMVLLKQPAQRLAIAKSTLVSLILLAILCAIPGWSVIHLLTKERLQPVAISDDTPPAKLTVATEPTHPMVSDAPAMQRVDSAAPQTNNAQPAPSIDFHLSWPALFVTTQLAGAACIALWLLLGLFASARLRRTARSAPANLVELLNEVFEESHGGTNRPRLLTHDRIDVAVALGAWRPTILLPSRWIRGETREHLQTVLAHESTHVQNHDLQWVALTRLLFIALWASPLFWLTRRWLRRDQEALADAAAAALTSRQRYAEQLVAWARDISGRPSLHLSSAVGLWEGPSQLRQRIALLLNERLTNFRDCSRRWRLASFVTGGILAFGLSLVTLRLAEPLPARADEKQSTTADGEKKDAKPKPVEMGTLKVELLDANDQPIKGVKVKPYGMRSNNDGSHYGWFGDNERGAAPQETTTDDDGIATVRYPRNVDEEHPVNLVSLQLNHPDFVAATKDVPIGETPSKVHLQHGGVVEVTVEGGNPKLDELFGVGGPWTATGWTRTKDGKLRSPHLSDQNDEWSGPGAQPNDGGQDVRVFWFPKDKPAQFSPVEHVQIREGETQSIAVRLQPGVKFAGRLEDDVPRPIVDGHVVVTIDTPGQTDWHDWAPVNEDGTFEFESLPADDKHDLQIMAYCDGFISTTGGEDGSQLKPKNLRLNKAISDYVVEMEPTATAVVKLLDPAGRPVRGAKVYFFPNIFWSNGSNVVGGANYRTRDLLLDPDYLTKQMKEQRLGHRYQALTDEQGVAKVANIPAYPHEMMNVEHERLQLPLVNGPGGGRRYFTFTKLSPGDSAEETITLEPKTEKVQEKAGAKPANKEPAKGKGEVQPPRPQLNAKQRSAAGLQPNTITGRAVDEKDQPIAGAEAILFRINSVDASRKLVAKTSTDAEGKYRFENVIDIPKEFPDGKLWPLNPLDEHFVQVYVRAPGRVAEMQMDMRQQIASMGRVFDMKLLPAATLRGRVTGPDDKPVSGALVSVGVAGYTRWDEVRSARTKADGTYEINDVPAYSMDEYRKKEAEQKRSMESLRSNTYGPSTYVRPPVVSVEHPDFAIKHTTYESIPGMQDVKLSPAAVIEGRVVFRDSTKPAPGALVRLESPRSNGSRPTLQQGLSQHYAQARTDSDGKYRFTSVPVGNYKLSAELPNWVNVGIESFEASAGKTSTAPNLFLTAGGLISIRFVDDQTGKPIPLTPDTWADIAAHSFPLNTGISRPAWAPNAVANSAGRFELHAQPGKRSILVFHVNEGEKVKWVGKTSTGQLKPHAVVDVVEGKTVEVDIPVVEGTPKVTGTFSPLPTQVKVEPPPESQPNSKSSSDRSPNKKDGVYQKVIIPVVVAKHALILGGKRITTWEEIDAMIGALTEPSNAYPNFYITHGAMGSGIDKDAKPHFYELRRKYKLKGHSEGTLAARTSFRYDKIRDQADLVTDKSLRVEGTVVDSAGKPVAEAEVVLITPVDESLSYKDYNIAIVEGRIRNRVDEVVTDTDAAGRFAIYPPKGQKYSLIALHPRAGFNFARDEQLTPPRKLNLVSWASLASELAAEPGAKQTASLSTHMPEAADYPNITLDQHWSDLKGEQPTKAFSFRHVPPIFQTTIERGFAQADGGTISLPGASVSLLPGEERRLDLGPLSDKQRELLKWQRDEAQKRIDAARRRTEREK